MTLGITDLPDINVQKEEDWFELDIDNNAMKSILKGYSENYYYVCSLISKMIKVNPAKRIGYKEIKDFIKKYQGKNKDFMYPLKDIAFANKIKESLLYNETTIPVFFTQSD